MEKVLERIQEWFFAKKEYFVEFSNADTRLEGWFKAELIFLFNKLKQEKVIENFEREPNFPTSEGRKQVDFTILINGELHLCEIKALCISQAAGTPRNLHFYFRDDHVGLIKDFKKLDKLHNKNKWVVGFIYPNPESSEWKSEMSLFSENLKHWNCITDPLDFPEFLYISVWKQILT
jgi:hypothetical protein